jgi:uncharacterized membrane protein
MAYLFAAELVVGHHLGLPWVIVGRIVPVAADMVLAVLVGRLASEQGPLRRFQYVCNPLAILVSALHGQIEPIALMFGVGAFVVARRNRAFMSGVLAGLAIAAKSWPVLLLPGLVNALGRRRWIVGLASAGAVCFALLFTMPLVVRTDLVRAVKTILAYRSATGEWGWTGVAASVVGNERAKALGQAWSIVGTRITLGALLLAWVLWRKADGVDLTIALLMTFLVFTAGFGAQYLLWPVPFLVARPTRFTPVFILSSGAWAATAYLYLGNLRYPTYQHVHHVFMYWSIPVIVTIVAAMPWGRRKLERRNALIDSAGAADLPAPHA